jgi:hypothetical protein
LEAFKTGKVKVYFYERVETGVLYIEPKVVNNWKGIFGAMVGPADPQMKTTLATRGGVYLERKHDRGRRKWFTKGKLVESIALNYSSIAGLRTAGVLGLAESFAPRVSEHKKRGASHVDAIASESKIRVVQELDGLPTVAR